MSRIFHRAGGTEALRVLFVVNTLPPRDLSGAGEQVAQLAEGLRRAGHETRILGRGPGGVGGPKVLFPLFAPGPTLAAVRSWRPHVVQVHESDGGLAALALRLAAGLRWSKRQAPAPLLAALQQVSYVEERRAVRNLVDRRRGELLARPTRSERRFRRWRVPVQILLGRMTARLADVVLAPSRATAEELRRDYGARRIEILPNVTGGQGDGETGAGDRWADLPPAYFLFVGRLRIRKGVEVLLQALAEMASSGEAPPLLVAGDGERRGPIERRVEELGLGSEVRLLGRCRKGEVRRLLEGARALVVPSTYEGMPLVVLEAMEAGVPVVASQVSGIPEIVLDGETGRLVPPEDPGALAAVLRELWEAPARAAQLGAAGRSRFADRYRPRHAVEAWLAALRSAPPSRLRGLDFGQDRWENPPS